MITILLPDGTTHHYPGAALFVRSDHCPGEQCMGNKGGHCVIRSDGEYVACLESYPSGVSWCDCACEMADCEHVQMLLAGRTVNAEEERTQARAKALSAAQAVMARDIARREEKEM